MPPVSLTGFLMNKSFLWENLLFQTLASLCSTGIELTHWLCLVTDILALILKWAEKLPFVLNPGMHGCSLSLTFIVKGSVSVNVLIEKKNHWLTHGYVGNSSNFLLLHTFHCLQDVPSAFSLSLQSPWINDNACLYKPGLYGEGHWQDLWWRNASSQSVATLQCEILAEMYCPTSWFSILPVSCFISSWKPESNGALWCSGISYISLW